MCEPKSSGLSDASFPARRPMMLPAKSIVGSSLAARIQSITTVRAARSASLYANARDAALRVLSEFREGGQVRVDAVAVHAEIGLRPGPAARHGARG